MTTAGTDSPSGLRTFDPHRVGLAEADAWIGYYRHEWTRVLRALFVMVRSGFGLPVPLTLRGAWYVLRANQKWAPVPHNEPDAAREYMRRFYELVAAAHRERFDPARAAELEVEWWRVHRAMQRPELGSTASIDDLTAALAALYAHVYRVATDAVAPAARLRAEATVTSDRWVAQGCRRDDPALARERQQLVDSYATLRAAVAAS